MGDGQWCAPSPPLLSVVVAIVSDTTKGRTDVSHLIGCLDALSQQIDPPPFEIVVPYHPPVVDVEPARRRFPAVTFLPVDALERFTGRGDSREHHDVLRARGLAAARGEIVGLIEDHARPDQHWCARVAEAHQQGFAAVGGAIENGIDRPLNWAVYFCDFGRYQNPLREGESPFASDANIAYKRSVLEQISPVWRESFHEPTVNQALMSRGQRIALSPGIVVYQHRDGLQLGSALRERIIWGRSYAATRSTVLSPSNRILYIALSPALPGLLLLRMAARVLVRRRCLDSFLKALPLTTALSVSWCFGELLGYLTAHAGGGTHDTRRVATVANR
jgi:hypothetical protein